MGWAYYNEFDPNAAAWLRELIKAGLIAPGVVDERSIENVLPSDLAGFTQCHFFAGIGVWSYALRRAGWADDRPVWTGSCPCQPFSSAGKGGGFTDERHLWPAWFHLITTAKPRAVPIFGEQVASKDGLAWLDLVQTDMEGAGYAFGATDLCAAGVGAPHIRQRLFFVGHPIGEGLEGQRGGYHTTQGHREGAVRSATKTGEFGGMADAMPAGRAEGWAGAGGGPIAGCGGPGGMADADCRKQSRLAELRGTERDGEDAGRSQSVCSSSTRCDSGGMADTSDFRRDEQWQTENDAVEERREPRSELDGELPGGIEGLGTVLPEPRPAGPTNGLWQDADWLYCRDGKWRPVEPGTFPLANGAPARVGRLRGYGNAINAEVTAQFIGAYLDVRN